MEIISENVYKTYKIKKGFFKSYYIKVVEGFDYVIKQGEIIGLLGTEGSGKSTLIKLLSGNVLPSRGKIFVDGEEDYKKLKDNCEIISDFKDRKLLENESVYNNLVYFGEKYKVDSFSVEKNISVYKEIFELDKVINRKVNDLSYFYA